MPSSVGDDVDCDFFLSQNTVAHILGLDAGRGAREGRGRQNHNAISEETRILRCSLQTTPLPMTLLNYMLNLNDGPLWMKFPEEVDTRICNFFREINGMFKRKLATYTHRCSNLHDSSKTI